MSDAGIHRLGFSAGGGDADGFPDLDAGIVESARLMRAWWTSGTAAVNRGDVDAGRRERLAAFETYRMLRRDHGIEIWPEVELPALWRCVHPIGAVLGRAKYADGLVIYGCAGIGSDVDGGRPEFRGPCVLFPGARVIGNVVVGANVWIQPGTVVNVVPGVTLEIPDNSVVFPVVTRLGRIGWECKSTRRSVMGRFFTGVAEAHDDRT